MRALLVPLVLASLLAVSVPTVEAQFGNVGPRATLTVSVTDPARAFEPGTEGTLDLYGRYTVANAWGDPNADPEGDGQRPTRITFQVTQMPSWVTAAAVDPPEILVEPDYEAPVNGETPFGGVLVRIAIAPDAPALQREDIVVEAVAEQNGLIPAARALSAAIRLRAAEVAAVNLTGPASPFVIDGGRWNTAVFTVRNDGNANETTMLLNVTIRPEFSEVEFPQEIRLARGESQTVEVRIRTPWTERETGTLEFEAVPLKQDDEGPAARHSVDIVGESAVPGPSLLPLLLGVGLLGRLLRRRTAA